MKYKKQNDPETRVEYMLRLIANEVAETNRLKRFELKYGGVKQEIKSTLFEDELFKSEIGDHA